MRAIKGVHMCACEDFMPQYTLHLPSSFIWTCEHHVDGIV